ncbi:RT0821/Lpp0805 family surface protein [Govanella unica]|uniref:RT0821/Lpp0805 family surface protein n=1 Tax=Govanella unica TaxID=2975056 RepID=A0A9X3U006_9PROT|nr:RT0821/Lpp0805 family surface protein [Govania unica]MDA5195110.1 RT0821/Lpp0805 family surface protein [Govania unica]
MGAATGAILGAAIGTSSNCRGYRCRSSTSGSAIAIGALAGALIGGQIGRSMDAKDRQMYGGAQQQAFEYGRAGQPSYWRNPDSGNYGEVVPKAAYQRQNQYCREFTQTIVVGGQKEQGYGTACRQPDGSWKIVNNN